MLLWEIFQLALSPLGRLAICLILAFLLTIMIRWEREESQRQKPKAQTSGMLSVIPRDPNFGAYHQLVADRIELPIITPERHPMLETMNRYLDLLERECTEITQREKEENKATLQD